MYLFEKEMEYFVSRSILHLFKRRKRTNKDNAHPVLFDEDKPRNSIIHPVISSLGSCQPKWEGLERESHKVRE